MLYLMIFHTLESSLVICSRTIKIITINQGKWRKSCNFYYSWNGCFWNQKCSNCTIRKIIWFSNFFYHWIVAQFIMETKVSFNNVNNANSDQGQAHLNDVRFNSNWVFFTNNDCLKVDIQYQKSLKIPKFGLTEGVIFNSENCKLSWS